MTPEEIGAQFAELVPGAETSVCGGGPGFERATVDIPPAQWSAAIRAAREHATLDCDFFDWLSAVDEAEAGFRVVAHLWSTRHRHGVLVRSLLPPHDPLIGSVVELYPGAAWHERETHEMFGVRFDGHPGLTPLLLAPEFEGHPLRKDFVLASRVAKPWPGAKEPGESHAGGGRRQPMRPPGVPAPGQWGPAGEQTEPPRPARRGRSPGGTEPPEPPADSPAPREG